MVDPVAIAGGLANITLALPIIGDALTTMANFAVSNTITVLFIAMAVMAFAAGLIFGLFRRKRGRR